MFPSKLPAVKLLLAATVAVHLGPALRAQLLPAGAEFQVNTYTTSGQRSPALAVAGGGNFVVVWTSYGPDGSVAGIEGQRYSPDGAALGGEFQVNSYTTDIQRSPAVAADDSGNFVVVWSSWYQDGSQGSIQGQRYSADGTALGGEFQVNTTTTDNQRVPEVAVAGNGDFVVVWQSDNQDGSSASIQGQRYSSDGAALGGEFQVNTYTTSAQSSPALAVAAGGDFVVVWDSLDQNGSGLSVHGQRYSSDGAALGGEFQVNDVTITGARGAAVGVADSGDFVVVWGDSYDGSLDGIRGRRFSSDGSALGGEFQVNSYTTLRQYSSALAVAAGGRFVVTWTSQDQDGSDNGVYGQLFAPDGSPLSGEFRVNSHTLWEQEAGAAVAVDSTGEFVVVWQSAGAQDGDWLGIFGQRYSDPYLFTDGFESGTTAGWSSTTP